MWIWPLHGYYMIVYIYIFYCKIWGKTHVGCFWQLLKYVLCITALAYDSSCSAGCGTTTHWVDKCCRPQACESTALKQQQQQQQQQGTNSRLIRTGWWFQPLWNILVSWDDYSQYMEKQKMFQTTNQINCDHPQLILEILQPSDSLKPSFISISSAISFSSSAPRMPPRILAW